MRPGLDELKARFRRFEPIAILVCAGAAVFMHFHLTQAPRFAVGDELQYLRHAYAVYQFGVFGALDDVDTQPEPGMFFAPVYPGFLAGMMWLDASFASAVECVLRHNTRPATHGCAPDYGSVIAIQLILAAITLVLIWQSAKILCRSSLCAWSAALLALMAGEYSYYANHLLTESFVFPLFAAACLAQVIAWRGRSWRAFFMAGALIALSALVRPSYAYIWRPPTTGGFDEDFGVLSDFR